MNNSVQLESQMMKLKTWLQIQLELYSPLSSASASLTSYSDDICSFAVQTAEAGCSSQNSRCRCSDYQSGDLTKPDRAVDGIFGFGQHERSVISQLSSQGMTPKVFSHCLKGKDNGGGIMVLGEIVEPDIVYSPLVPSQPHYNLNLRSIAGSGQIVPIDPAVLL
ncbi:aspartic proteinase-like protein [Thalictrum thalictroides]|uniref:Aspartic proteinase-like protein n=1 Tax=Thalictrum thalictroides TaxID=46969 RepID=A0A7J6WBG1_THATH|nr:aspartic proteinase-like protein [Thalictrum thalictroides]